MDEYIINKLDNITVVNNKNKDYNYLIDQIKLISNGNIKNFMNKVSKNKNKVSDVEETLLISINILSNKKFESKDKLIIFYYIYFYNRLVLNYPIINLRKKIKLTDIEYKKPNSYIGYYGNDKYFFKIISDTDTDLLKIYKNYKIMEIYNITLPDLDLNYIINEYKTIVLPENRKLNNTDDLKEVFLQILNILRQFNNNNLFVVFDYWNIRFVNNKYYLLNLINVKKYKKINTKKQISMLRDVLKLDINIKDENYDRIFMKFLNTDTKFLV